ncbi:MAG: helix-turn-helix domain-containing protein [Candidatus Aenigmatarchaeota archaeon]
MKEALLELGAFQTWPRWLSTREACRYSGLSKDMLYKLRNEGEIYATTVGGGKLLWDKESIDEFLLKDKKNITLKVKQILE